MGLICRPLPCIHNLLQEWRTCHKIPCLVVPLHHRCIIKDGFQSDVHASSHQSPVMSFHQTWECPYGGIAQRVILVDCFLHPSGSSSSMTANDISPQSNGPSRLEIKT